MVHDKRSTIENADKCNQALQRQTVRVGSDTGSGDWRLVWIFEKSPISPHYVGLLKAVFQPNTKQRAEIGMKS
ncbi:hypothetical protein N7481_012679 [Penicillium waksmanii]|uniref:uncharacterized protein n=1 Tax=Penicillium waksmanii TaxID=69791 RepID=UPI002548AD65|nr:uncharacterized protein N7481_012679 [Penicillium waksmanii]KAJ5965965.1 hypothetical protein N7481_012679 [Penicillium waksmanii]